MIQDTADVNNVVTFPSDPYSCPYFTYPGAVDYRKTFIACTPITQYSATSPTELFDIGQVTLNTNLKLTIRLPNSQPSFPARTVTVSLLQTASPSTAISTSISPSSIDIANSQDYVFQGAVIEAGTKGASLNITQDNYDLRALPY